MQSHSGCCSCEKGAPEIARSFAQDSLQGLGNSIAQYSLQGLDASLENLVQLEALANLGDFSEELNLESLKGLAKLSGLVNLKDLPKPVDFKGLPDLKNLKFEFKGLKMTKPGRLPAFSAMGSVVLNPDCAAGAEAKDNCAASPAPAPCPGAAPNASPARDDELESWLEELGEDDWNDILPQANEQRIGSLNSTAAAPPVPQPMLPGTLPSSPELTGSAVVSTHALPPATLSEIRDLMREMRTEMRAVQDSLQELQEEVRKEK